MEMRVFVREAMVTVRKRGNVQNSLAKELYIVSYTTFETIKETNISSFRNSRSILELESKRLAGRVRKCHIDLESLRLELLKIYIVSNRRLLTK